MRRIYAISDGRFQTNNKIDKTLVSLLNKENPKIVLLPMALELPSFPETSLKSWVDQFQKRYGEELGCQTDVIYTNDNPSEEMIREKILSADAVYVGPGHVPTMLDKMKQFGFDKILREGYEKGIVMAGMSAGAMCWFEPYLRFAKSKFHPHYQGYERINDGYAAKDPTATLFVDERIGQVVKLDQTADVYLFKTVDGVRKRITINSPSEANTVNTINQ